MLSFRHLLFSALVSVSSVLAAQAAPELPAPKKTGGKPLQEVLAARATGRDFDADAPELSPAQLSNLLWSAYGVNRADGRRTAPSALNRQDITLYVLLKSGTHTYDATLHALMPVTVGDAAPGDIRALGGKQAFAAKAQLTLVYVSNFSSLGKPAGNADAREMAAVSAGAISQNISLYCASENLITGVRMSIDKEKLGKALGLTPAQYIVLAQSVGTKTAQ